ncbi:MAG: glycosyltransferase [Bacteroidia bacterium]|nr:glycosyltransferase [Bacteroidia bacterium]
MKVTVLLPVYNGEKYLEDACRSVLNQSFHDFELLIINDGSSDRTSEIINSFSDPRLRVVNNEQNIGLIKTLNKGIDLAKSDLIARMDADDICRPKRLQLQVDFMNENPDIAISGGLFQAIGTSTSNVVKQPTNPDVIKSKLLFHTVLAHPTVIYRKEALVKNSLYYDESYKHAEDYELWVRASRRVKISNLNEVLIDYRFHDKQVSAEFNNIQIENLNRCRVKQLDEIGISAGNDEIEIHLNLANQNYRKEIDFVKQAEKWLLKLHDHNCNVGFFDRAAFDRTLGSYWVAICKNAAVHKVFKGSNLNSLKFLTFAQKMRYGIAF